MFTILNVSRNHIKDKEVERLAELLLDNKVIVTLNLSENEITAHGSKFLAHVIAKNKVTNNLYMYLIHFF